MHTNITKTISYQARIKIKATDLEFEIKTRGNCIQ